MNRKNILLLSIAVGSLLTTIVPLSGQGTAFTYQGRLNDRGSPANGIYDFSASLFTGGTAGSAFAGPITNSSVTVSNGLFIATLDFGGVFHGTSYWLELAVRTNGSGAFTILSPRQQLTPTPYADFALTSSNLSGALSLAQLPPGVVTNNSAGVNLNGTFAGNGTGLSNVNAQTLNGLSSASFLSVVNPTSFGAVGDNLADDTAALQAAFDYAGYSNGASKLVHIPAGRYKCTTGLVIPKANELHILGDDSGDGDTTILDFSSAAASVNGLTFSSLHAANGGICGLQIEGISVMGRTNGATGHGIFLGDPGYTTNSNFGPIGRFGMIRNCNVSGFADGISLYDWETCLIDHCGVYYNTNICIHLVRADSCVIRDCQVGWGLYNNTTTALGNFGYSLGVHVYGGEWGNCLRRLWQDGGVTIWYGGNCENVTSEACLFTNICRYLELGCRNISRYAVPCWHVMCNPSLQDNEEIQIIDSTCEGSFNHRVLVEGNTGPMPHVLSPLPSPAIEAASTIGGPITSTYDGASSIVDKNYNNTWNEKQVFKGRLTHDSPALRIQNGVAFGAMELGADLHSNTVTANTAKTFTLAAPRYANQENQPYQIGFLQYDADAGNDIARWGTGEGLFGVTRHQFWTASSEGSVASEHWEIGAAGNMSAIGTEALVTAGQVVAGNHIGSGTSPSGFPGGGLTNAVFSPAADYTLTNVNCYVTMTAGHSLTLPSATTNGGSWVCVFNTDNLASTIRTVLAQKINGGTQWTNATQYASTFLFSDGTQWWAR